MKTSHWVALFFLAALGVQLAASAGGTSAAAPEMVTLKLEEFQDLFRKAHLATEQQRLDKEREELHTNYRNKLKDLSKQKNSWQAEVQTRASARGKVVSGNWLLLNHSVAGFYQLPKHGDLDQLQGLAAFDFELKFHIFEDGWTALPLIESQVIVGQWDVSKQQVVNSDVMQLQGTVAWVPEPFGPELMLMLKARPDEVVTGEAAHAMYHTLITNRSGTYRVRFRAHSHVRHTRNLHALSLTSVYPLSTVNFRIEHPLLQDQPQSIVKEFSVEPAAFYSISDRGGLTEVEMRLPSTTTLELKWRSVAAGTAPAKQVKGKALSNTSEPSSPEEAASEDGKEQPPQATVQHNALISIADGVVQSSNIFKFSFDSEQPLSLAEVLVFGGARVTGVVAHGMQTWRAMPTNVSAQEAGDGPHGNATLVQVFFKTSTMSKEAIVLITAESSFEVEQGRVELAVMACRNVLRQSGTLAVVKAANAEVYESASRGAARAGLGDVPMSVRSQTDQPIVLAYKYLSPRYLVELHVLHHEEIPTLRALVDTALYQVLVVDTQTMHKLTMIVQNSQQQYMVVRDIPSAASIWSLRVNSLSVQPSRGRDGSLLVPLLVGTGGDSNEGGVAPLASVELAWTTEHPPLGSNGSLSLAPPRVDLPVTALSVEAQLPEMYTFNFSGTMQNVSIFSHKQPRAVNYQTERHVVEEGFKFGAPPQQSEEKASVKAAIPKQGTRYRFEKILVIGDNAVLTAAYQLRTSMTPDGGWRMWAWPFAHSGQ